MLKITHSEWSVTMRAQQRDGCCGKIINHPKQVLSLQWWLYSRMFSFLITNAGLDATRAKRPPTTKMIFFLSKRDKEMRGFNLSWTTVAFPKDRQSHGCTVKSSSACFVCHPIYLNLSYFQIPKKAQRTKNLFFFSFTCCLCILLNSL